MNRMLTMEEGTRAYDLCGQLIGFALKVHSAVGPGFLESVYKNALALELRRAALMATRVDEGLLLNFGGPRLEFKKKFRVPKTESVSL